MTRRHDDIERALVRLERLGIVRDWMVQSQMPSTRWSVLPAAPYDERKYTTAEVEAFIVGAYAGRGSRLD